MTDRRQVFLAPRNDPLGFATRTRKNLEIIECAFSRKGEGHVVTQLMISLLGLIVFPWEKDFYKKVSRWRLEDLERSEWPKWEMPLEKSKTLGCLMRHLRNAIAHNHVIFSSDSRHINDVSIEFSDYKNDESDPYWRASIEARHLRDFCFKLIGLIESP